MTTIELLEKLANDLEAPQIKRAHKWGSADVIISKNRPEITRGAVYSASRYVITEHALELSWLFEALRDAFNVQSLLDSCSKIKFFGRLANAANRFLFKNTQVTAQTLCGAVLHEAFAIHEELMDGEFEFLEIAVGNEFADDYIDECIKTGFIGIHKTIEFFKSHGVDLSHDGS